MSDGGLVATHVRTLFVLDGDDRLLAVNEPGRPAAPRFLLVRTATENRAWYRHDLPATVVAALDRLVAAEPIGGAPPGGEAPRIAAAARALVAGTGPIVGEWRGPAFAFPAVTVRRRTATTLAVATANRSELLGDRFGAEWDDVAPYQPFVVARVAGETVALCHAARRSAGAAEAGVVTLAEHRGRGYGGEVVARWAEEARAAGLVPLYSCAWENAASRGLARSLGLRPYAEDWHLT